MMEREKRGRSDERETWGKGRKLIYQLKFGTFGSLIAFNNWSKNSNFIFWV